jgi:catechol 2,3-dioxygenase-like lactoylglutathione lyase family enzyme
MRVVPVIKCRDMQRSLAFYTRVLCFARKHDDETELSEVVDLVNGEAEVQLSSVVDAGEFGASVYLRVNELADVDRLFTKYVSRGLNTSLHAGSPVHRDPVNRRWGVREFYVADPDGNPLRFGHPLD